MAYVQRRRIRKSASDRDFCKEEEADNGDFGISSFQKKKKNKKTIKKLLHVFFSNFQLYALVF